MLSKTLMTIRLRGRDRLHREHVDDRGNAVLVEQEKAQHQHPAGEQMRDVELKRGHQKPFDTNSRNTASAAAANVQTRPTVGLPPKISGGIRRPQADSHDARRARSCSFHAFHAFHASRAARTIATQPSAVVKKMMMAPITANIRFVHLFKSSVTATFAAQRKQPSIEVGQWVGVL
jgi:hypothetical protein